LDLTYVGNKAKGNTPQTSSGHSIEPILFRGYFFPLLFGPLPKDAVVVRRTGGLELERDSISLLIKPVKCLFIVEGRDLLVLEFFSTARGNEEKEMMGHGTETDGKT
jgi:hypothetical protein